VAPLFIGAPVLLLVGWVACGVRVVRPHQGAVLERFGRYRKTCGPGVQLTLPLVHKLVRVDNREQLVDVGAYCVTRDDVSVGLDLAVSFRCVDPRRFVYDVADPGLAISRSAEANVRKLVGLLTLEDVVDTVSPLCSELTLGVNELVEPWGAVVTRVEVPRIDLPEELVDAMQQKATSERTRVALVTQAENDAQVAVAQTDAACRARLVEAEAQRKATILEAEGEAAAAKVLAEAARYRQECLARAQADAIKIVSAAIREGTQGPDLIAVKYVEALVPYTGSPSADDAAAIRPTELAALIQPVPEARNGAAEARSAPIEA
jgi:regulator of protease activity HflC (stomatin/prohibitin superfamily)